MSAFVLVIGFLITGFLAMTAVFIVMTDDPDLYEELVQNNQMDKRRHQMMLFSSEDSGENEKNTRRTMRVFTIPSITTPETTVRRTSSTTASTTTSTIPKTLSISTTKIPGKFMRISPVTIKLNNSVFQGIMDKKVESTTNPEVKFTTFPMDPISEINIPNKSGKLITLLLRNGLLYLPTTSGEIKIFNSTNYKLAQDFKTPFALRNFAFFNESHFIVVEGKNNKMSLIDDRSLVKEEKKLDYALKDLQALKDHIYVLSRSNEEIYVYNDKLEEVKLIHFINDLRETCNFLIPTEESIFVSCQTGILELDLSGKIKRKFKSPGGSYSLAISLYKNSLFAVQRGRQEIHSFNLATGTLEKKFISKSPGSAIWSSLLIDNHKFLLFERITNAVKILSTTGL
ncbi:hypothetical protein FO519_002118 [Halicephalobus sp. NKZ332]|nr:hypothetical protein FO519_002118 [Halicephalobus sp. NKZ332]